MERQCSLKIKIISILIPTKILPSALEIYYLKTSCQEYVADGSQGNEYASRLIEADSSVKYLLQNNTFDVSHGSVG